MNCEITDELVHHLTNAFQLGAIYYTRGFSVAMKSLSTQQQIELEAAAFRRLLQHLDERKDAQNIDLMNLAGFCRNCLSKWLVAAADERELGLDYEAAREHVYGMPYAEWKAKYQTEANAEQLQKFDEAMKK